MVQTTHPLLSERNPFAVFVFLMMVYFQIKWFYQYSANLRQEADHRDNRLIEMHLKNQKILDQFASRLDVMRSDATKMIQLLEGRVEALEGKFNDLVSAELAILKATTADLREQLESGAHWGRKRQELQAQMHQVMKREVLWTKAFEN